MSKEAQTHEQSHTRSMSSVNNAIREGMHYSPLVASLIAGSGLIALGSALIMQNAPLLSSLTPIFTGIAGISLAGMSKSIQYNLEIKAQQKRMDSPTA